MQTAFFSVSTIGVIIATMNHFWFVRDRNLSNILAIKNMLQEPFIQYCLDIESGNDLSNSLMRLMNAIVMYCIFHNENQIKKSTKKIHQDFVSLVIEELFSDLETLKENLDYSRGAESVKTFVAKNSNLFSDQLELLLKIDELSSQSLQ